MLWALSVSAVLLVIRKQIQGLFEEEIESAGLNGRKNFEFFFLNFEFNEIEFFI